MEYLREIHQHLSFDRAIRSQSGIHRLFHLSPSENGVGQWCEESETSLHIRDSRTNVEVQGDPHQHTPGHRCGNSSTRVNIHVWLWATKMASHSLSCGLSGILSTPNRNLFYLHFTIAKVPRSIQNNASRESFHVQTDQEVIRFVYRILLLNREKEFRGEKFL